MAHYAPRGHCQWSPRWDYAPYNVPPLVEDLAGYLQTGELGTTVENMVAGLEEYVRAQGLANVYVVEHTKGPTKNWMRSSTRMWCSCCWDFGSTTDAAGGVSAATGWASVARIRMVLEWNSSIPSSTMRHTDVQAAPGAGYRPQPRTTMMRQM